MESTEIRPEDRQRDDAVRDACVAAALAAFEDASISGLCCTGAWEVAIGAMRTLDLKAIVVESRIEQ